MRTYSYWVVRLLPAFDAVAQAALLPLFFTMHLSGTFLRVALIFLFIPLTQYLFQRFGVYDSHRLEGASGLVRKIFSTHVIALFIFLAAGIASESRFSSLQILSFFTASAVVLSLQRVAIYMALRLIRRRGFDRRNVCIMAEPQIAKAYSAEFQAHPEWGLSIACIGTGTPGCRSFRTFPSDENLGSDFEQLLRVCIVDEVLIAVCPTNLAQESRSIHLYEQYGLQVRVLLQMEGEDRAARMEDFHGAPAMSVTSAPRTERQLALKRVFDLVIASLLTVAMSPVFVIIAVLVSLSSKGPILFRQTRVGLNGRRFTLVKFRTMVDGAESLIRNPDRSITKGPMFKDPNDYRITPFGRFLRRFSIDELPQLFNVLRGEMSMVGPRPLPVYEADLITGESRRRFSVPPGITCVWQVNGRNDLAYETWMKYDLQYVDKWSLWQDAMLVLRTVPAVFSRKGAY